MNSPFIPPFDLERHLLAPWRGGIAQDTAFTIVMAALVAVACGWLGCWLILQGLALIGDAISHTVLLGIVLAFLLTGSVLGPGMFVAATITGLVTVGLIDLVHLHSRVKEDAAVGIVFTSLFALGVVLLVAFAGRAHIDKEHVLFGNLDLVTLEPSVHLWGVDVPIPVCQMGVLVCLLVGGTIAFYKELVVSAFDPQLAQALGMRPRLVRYGMLAALSLTVVGSFTAVGAVLVVAMLIAPAATAFLLTQRLPTMLALSSLVGALSAVVGFHLGYWLEVDAAPPMACVACGMFTLAFCFAPQQGLVATWWRRERLRFRTHQENIIRQLWRLSAGRSRAPLLLDQVTAQLSLNRWRGAWSLRALVHRGWIEISRDAPRAIRLTDQGMHQGERLDRAHRLWETYLVDQIGLPSDHVHPSAELVEHVLSEQFVERLDDLLGHPDIDPHGAPIPRSPVNDQTPGVFTLSKLRLGDRGRVVGLAGSPDPMARGETVEQRTGAIAGLRLTLGQLVTVTARDPAGRIWTVQLEGGSSIDLSHELADSILVRVEQPAPHR
ncbi:MAG: metal ABC transporter permease [Planctomycetales bacterium]